MAFIYCFTFPNNKKYIGYAKNNPKGRWSVHKYLSKNTKSNSKLYNAIRKYGFDNIVKEILEENPDDNYTLTVLEDYYIKKFNTIEDGYNSVEGGGKFPVYYGKDNYGYSRKGRKIEEFFTPEQVEKTKRLSSIANSGKNNNKARKLNLISPDGISYIIHGELKTFCNEHNLSFSKMYSLLDRGGGTIPPLSNKANFTSNKDFLKNCVGWTIIPL